MAHDRGPRTDRGARAARARNARSGPPRARRLPRRDLAARAGPPASAQPAPRVPANTLDAVRESGRLRLCVAAVAPWAIAGENGTFRGYAIDLADRLASDLGVERLVVEVAYADLLPALTEGDCDLLIGLSPTAERALFANFTAPLRTSNIRLLATAAIAAERRSRDAFDRADTTVGGLDGSADAAAAGRALPKAKLRTYSGLGELMAALSRGEVQAVALSDPLATLSQQASQGKLALPLEQAIGRRGDAIAIRRGDPDFLSYLETWIRMHDYDGFLGDRAAYWLTGTAWMASEPAKP